MGNETPSIKPTTDTGGGGIVEGSVGTQGGPFTGRDVNPTTTTNDLGGNRMELTMLDPNSQIIMGQMLFQFSRVESMMNGFDGKMSGFDNKLNAQTQMFEMRMRGMESAVHSVEENQRALERRFTELERTSDSRSVQTNRLEQQNTVQDAKMSELTTTVELLRQEFKKMVNNSPHLISWNSPFIFGAGLVLGVLLVSFVLLYLRGL